MDGWMGGSRGGVRVGGRYRIEVIVLLILYWLALFGEGFVLVCTCVNDYLDGLA